MANVIGLVTSIVDRDEPMRVHEEGDTLSLGNKYFQSAISTR